MVWFVDHFHYKWPKKNGVFACCVSKCPENCSSMFRFNSFPVTSYRCTFPISPPAHFLAIPFMSCPFCFDFKVFQKLHVFSLLDFLLSYCSFPAVICCFPFISLCFPTCEFLCLCFVSFLFCHVNFCSTVSSFVSTFSCTCFGSCLIISLPFPFLSLSFISIHFALVLLPGRWSKSDHGTWFPQISAHLVQHVCTTEQLKIGFSFGTPDLPNGHTKLQWVHVFIFNGFLLEALLIWTAEFEAWHLKRFGAISTETISRLSSLEPRS